MNLRYIVVALTTFLCSLLAFSAHASENESEADLWIYDDDITVPSLLNPNDPASEVIYLPANVFVPKSDDPDARFPAVIFISSWALNEYEYAPQAKLLAENGYVVLSYTARGFYNSPGQITTAGVEDYADASSAIDYLLDSTNAYPVDPNAIGLSGISYGAGISLLTGFTDERVKAIAAMSGWVDLIDSLWAGNTPNSAWINLLIASAQPIPFIASNNPSPEIEANYMNMKLHQNVEATKEWGYLRSAATYLDQANSRGTPPAVYIANNLHDYLFQPDSLFTALDQYQGEWRLDLSRGIHASGEAGGLLGNDDHTIWLNVGMWFDHHLKGIDNGIDRAAPFSTKVLNISKRESYSSLHPEDEIKVFNLIPESGKQGGALSDVYGNTVDMELSFSTLKKVASTGGLTGAYAHTGRTLDFNNITPENGMVFLTPVLEETLRLRGEAKVHISVVAEDKAQYFAYLYYLNPETGVANWVGHAPFSCHQSEGCAVNEGQVEDIILDFYWTSVDIPAGRQLMLIVDGADPGYWRYETTPEENTVVFNSSQQATLELPIVWENTKYDDPVANYQAAQGLNRGANGDASS
ncbi:MAG: hypothetical protein D9N11_03510, partial [Ketobacter sp.]